MTEEDKKAWDVTVHRANRGNEFFSIYDANAILAADEELKRLRAIVQRSRDVEGMAKVMEDVSFTAGWTWKHFARAVSAFLKGEG